MKNLLLILLTTILFSGFGVGQSLVYDFNDDNGEIDSNTLGAGL